jgi:protein TonB
MFKVLSGQKRRVISPATIAASIAAHLLLLGGAVYAAASDAARPPEEMVKDIVELYPEEPKQPEPVDPVPPPPAPAQPDEPAPEPVPGETLQLETPAVVPTEIEPEPAGVVPVRDDEYTGQGPVGNVIGEPTGEPVTVIPPAPTVEPAVPFVPDESMVEVRPELDRGGLARAMERYYPSVLRDSRVAGRVVIEMIVDTDGRVRDGSVRVVETSHPAFGEAAMRAAERFRFRPARMAGTPVPVRVTLPIQWTVPR